MQKNLKTWCLEKDVDRKTWKQKNGKLEEVKEFKYLGYILMTNNEESAEQNAE